MSFMPRISAETSAIETRRPLVWRRWPGVIADVWHVRGAAGGGGYYVSPYPRLVVFLGEDTPTIRLRAGNMRVWQDGVRAFFVPAGVPLWSNLRQSQNFAHLDLHLDANPLAQRLRSAIPTSHTNALRFLSASDAASDRVQPLANMLVAEVETPHRPDLMLDGLLTAILTEVLDLGPIQTEAPERGGLSPHILRQIAQYTAENLHRRITVEDLAQIAGLSPSWFTRAFKQSLHTTPQRWLTQRRLTAATELMADAVLGLAEIASATGFADQAHLTRTFRAARGETPGVWRRGRLSADRSNPGSLVQSADEFQS